MKIIQTTLLSPNPMMLIEIYRQFFHWSKFLNPLSRLSQQAKVKSPKLQQKQLNNLISKQNRNSVLKGLMYVIRIMWNWITFDVKHASLSQTLLNCTPITTNHRQLQLMKALVIEQNMLPNTLNQSVTKHAEWPLIYQRRRNLVLKYTWAMQTRSWLHMWRNYYLMFTLMQKI